MIFLKGLYLTNRFFYIILGLSCLCVLSFFVKILFILATIAFWLVLALFFWDLLLLYSSREGIHILRHYPEKLSNGDPNNFVLEVHNTYPRAVKLRVLEEFPIQFQYRDEALKLLLGPQQIKRLDFVLRPTTRGIYTFGKCNVFVAYWGFFERRYVLDQNLELPCYPSFIQLRKYLLLATTNRLHELGVKRIRKIGSTLDFDHIREYVQGDDYRFINWKATAKTKSLMVNQYQEERSQPIYSFIDTGRAMRMPFRGMTLLDYAINATLVLSNAAILKQDRAGMLSFASQVEHHVAADKRNNQMQLISEQLYSIQTTFEETEFGKLYSFCNKHINKRSLLFIYSNFETLDALNRQLQFLKMMNRSHIVVVVVFRNTELVEVSKLAPLNTFDIYNQIIAEKLLYEKDLIIQELNRQGMQTIYTNPEQLTITTINKYLEIKARGLI